MDDGSIIKDQAELRTGDIVQERENQLFVIGRKGLDFAKINGHRVNFELLRKVRRPHIHRHTY